MDAEKRVVSTCRSPAEARAFVEAGWVKPDLPTDAKGQPVSRILVEVH